MFQLGFIYFSTYVRERQCYAGARFHVPYYMRYNSLQPVWDRHFKVPAN